jgi:hypothetical protein
MGRHTERSYYLRTLILGIMAALASCLLALALATLPAQAATQPGDLSISQSDSPDPLESGNVTYTLTVKHELVDGCSGGYCYDSGAIRVTDTVPSGVDIVSVNPSSSSVSCTITTSVTCTKSYLYDGSSFNVGIVLRATAAGAQTVTNAVTVSRFGDYGYQDPNTANNTATTTTQVSDTYTPTPDTTPPETALTQKPAAFSSNVSPSFSFTADEGPPSFECKLDTDAFQPCTSSKQLFLLSDGPHTFQVRAKDPSGNIDSTPAEYTWTVDSFSPKITFTQRPGNATGPSSWDEWVTNDRSPTWAWDIADANLNPAEDYCYLYDDTYDRYIVNYSDCTLSAPYTFGGELPDGHYHFTIATEDKAGNYDSTYNYFEVDTVAPKFVSGKPTGRLVSRYADVVVTFDDNVYKSAKFVNIYKRGTTTPLAVYRYGDGYRKIEVSPKNSLRRDTWYTVKVTTGVSDGANNLEAPKTWSFKTK